MRSARWSPAVFAGGGAFALAFAITGVGGAALLNFVLHVGNPNYGGATSNFRAGVYFALAGSLIGTPAFIAVTAAFPSWRALSLPRAAAFGFLAGVPTFVSHLYGLFTPISSLVTPQPPGRWAGTAIYFLIPAFMAALVAALSVLSVARIRRPAAT
jgi:hypothetical protein